MIFIENRKRSKNNLEKDYPSAEIIDLTSKGVEPFLRLSPFYPHGEIPVPFSKNIVSYSVEGIWQGLKVFENFDIDTSKFLIQNMKGIKRSVRRYGKPIGHKKGVNGELIDYLSARKKIYLPSYIWVLDNKASEIVDLLIMKAKSNDLVFLDYQTNEDIQNADKPISHAALVKQRLEEKYPKIALLRFTQPERRKNLSTKQVKEKNKNQLSMGFD